MLGIFSSIYLFLCTGEDEEADTSEAMKKFKKAKQKKTVVSLLAPNSIVQPGLCDVSKNPSLNVLRGATFQLDMV